MREINKADGPLAMIGLPCHFHSLFNAQKRLAPHWAELITLKIGLVCERVLSYAIFDCLLAIKSLTRLHCKYYRFRSKNRIGWPGEDNAVLWDDSSVTIPDHYRQKYKDCLTPLRCHLCFDKMNILADIIAADPWGFCRDKVGSTILAARTALGFQVIKDVAQQKDISLEPVTWQNILRGQHVEEKRLFWSNFTQFVKEKNEKFPNIAIEQRRSSSPIVAKYFIPFFELIFQQSKLLSAAQTRQCVLDSIPHFQKNYDQSIKSIKENKK
jgi:coenzyme F420 hydrogenase subunit beta